MPLLRKGTELDRWAAALGASTDDEAMKALSRLMARLRVCQEQAAELARATTDAPDPDVTQGARVAAQEIDTARGALLAVHRKFQTHQRGR